MGLFLLSYLSMGIEWEGLRGGGVEGGEGRRGVDVEKQKKTSVFPYLDKMTSWALHKWVSQWAWKWVSECACDGVKDVQTKDCTIILY